MSEIYVVHCDQCDADITFVNERSGYRIRIMSESRGAISNDNPAPSYPELRDNRNFCNLAHMKEWVNTHV